MNKEQEPILVAIHCLVYNHGPYLRQCFEGFVMQKTNFRFIAVVHEDASTDNSAEIVREYEEKYPNIFKPIYETENQYQKGDGKWRQIMADAIAVTGCKYVAMCEGDDYWTDPLKLQKQVDFLEANPEYTLCCSNAKVWDQKQSIFITDVLSNSPGGEIPSFILAEGNKLHTPTAIYRRDERISRDFYQLGFLYVGDYPLWLLCLKYGKVYRFEEEMALYRKMSGIWSTMENIRKNTLFLMALCKLRPLLVDSDFIAIVDKQIEFNRKCVFDIADSMAHTKISKSYRLGYAILHPWSLFSKIKK